MSHLSLACQGKGITDQDRNILSNQRLILDFLRSAAHCLTLGQIPIIHSARRRKKRDDDDEPQEGDISGSDVETAPTTGTWRGTVLITLRNVPPYTAWYVWLRIRARQLTGSQGYSTVGQVSSEPHKDRRTAQSTVHTPAIVHVPEGYVEGL